MAFVSNFSGEKVIFDIFWLALMMKIYVLSFGISLWSSFTLLVSLTSQFLALQLVFVCFLDGSRFFKEPAGIACYAFEAFSRGCILLELEMISFLPIFL